MSAKLLIDVGVELLHHEDQDDILTSGVPYDRTLSACIGLHGTSTVREFNPGGVCVQRSRWGYS